MTRFVVVTGTDTGVGKTIATAALAASARRNGARVAVVKPVQTGLAAGAPGSDMDVVRELTGHNDVHELVRLRAPLAPDTAARLEKRELPAVGELALQAVRRTAARRRPDRGSRGVRVRLDSSAETSSTSPASWRGAPVAQRSHSSSSYGGPRDANHTDLTSEPFARRSCRCSGSSWLLAVEPDLAARATSRTWQPARTADPGAAARRLRAVAGGGLRVGRNGLARPLGRWRLTPALSSG
jgi:dethiobiotin synthetase